MLSYFVPRTSYLIPPTRKTGILSPLRFYTFEQMKQNRFSCRLLLILVLLVTLEANAQFDSSFVKSQITKCADSLAYGFRTRNWEVFARYSNPAMIGTMGGKEEFIRFIVATFADIPLNAWKKYQPGPVLQVLQSGPDLQCVIELNSIIEVEGKRITAKSHLIGQSWDGGIFWTFFDSQNNLQASRQIKPDLNEAIVIPAKVPDKVDPITRPSPLKPEGTVPLRNNK